MQIGVSRDSVVSTRSRELHRDSNMYHKKELYCRGRKRKAVYSLPQCPTAGKVQTASPRPWEKFYEFPA